MARKRSFIPTSFPAYDRFYKNITQYVAQMTSGSTPTWTHIPQAEITTLSTAYAAWYTVYSRILKPHTPADTAAVKIAYATSKKVLSRFIQVWFRGFPEVVTEEHLSNMEIPPVDKTRTRIGRPTTRPVFYIEVKDTRLLVVHFQDQGSESRAIPYGLNGAVVSLGIFDTPPAGPEALTRTELATKSPFPLHFTEEERGKTVYIALQWQNESGVRGDYTEMLSAIVP
ncbi:MAG: hypothetical protein LBC60_12275 [Spirochaetaceae bacterium]|jgi:hypothetical protein|nr:hypothetical protein [Spirochaetaceae bacterium]